MFFFFFYTYKLLLSRTNISTVIYSNKINIILFQNVIWFSLMIYIQNLYFYFLTELETVAQSIVVDRL